MVNYISTDLTLHCYSAENGQENHINQENATGTGIRYNFLLVARL